RAAGPPPAPLISAYKPTAVINEWPTSAPTISNMIQKARDAQSSRNSFVNNSRKLGERKEDLLDATFSQTSPRTQFVDRAFRYRLSVIQQHQPVANSARVDKLMNRQQERTSTCRLALQQRHHVARLSQVQTIERFVEQQQRVRRQQPEPQHAPFALAFRKRAELRLADLVQSQWRGQRS